MAQPKGFEDKSCPDHVCPLHKAIYGLKQAPRQWYNTFTAYLVSLGFTHNTSDPSLLIYHKSNTRIYLLVYVDDILITGNNQVAIANILNKLSNEFAMKHLGEIHDFLGINITKWHNQFFLSQKKYAAKLLELANLTTCNSLFNPTYTKLPSDIDPNSPLLDPTT